MFRSCNGYHVPKWRQTKIIYVETTIFVVNISVETAIKDKFRLKKKGIKTKHKAFTPLKTLNSKFRIALDQQWDWKTPACSQVLQNQIY